MSIQAYSGEYLISPIPMEMSMNYCSILCYEERGKQIPYLSKSNKSYILYFDKNQHTGGVFISN